MNTATRSQPPAAQTKNHGTNTHIRPLHLCTRGGSMDAADLQRSPPDRDGGSTSSPSPSNRGGGCSSTPPAAGSQPEVIEVDDIKAVLVITPALVYDMKGEVLLLFVVVLTLTRIIKSVVTGQAPVTLELRNTPGKNTNNPRCYTHISQLTQFMPPPETNKSEIGSQSTMSCARSIPVHTSHYSRLQKLHRLPPK